MWATSLYYIKASIFVTRDIYGNVVAFIKQQCQKVATQFIIELQGQFPTQDFMDASGNYYPQYWLQLEFEKSSMHIWESSR
jgi:hypothetical protein